MEQNWLTIEVNEKGQRVLRKCAKEAEGEVVIPQGITEIGTGAFEGCDSLSSISLPSGSTNTPPASLTMISQAAVSHSLVPGDIR